MTAETLELVWPSHQYLPNFRQALEKGWSPEPLRPEASVEYLNRVDANADLFLEQQIDPPR